MTCRTLLLPMLLLLVCGVRGATRRNNIIFILVDDAGYADFESHDPSMYTRNIRALRQDGVFLNQSYVLPMCAPSRAAFMTGRYPHTFGLQDASINGNMLNWINESFTFLPRELQRLNYTTHMLGKWHLGYCHPAFTPRGRGFDSFYGFLLGSHDSYYNHTKNNGNVYDWWENERVDYTARGLYQTDLLNTRAVQIIEAYDGRRPFFMYLAYGAPHGPLECPDHYMEQYCPHVSNITRKIHCGMMAAVDVGVGELVKALKQKGLYEDTVILFMSDNGGPVKKASVNYPLRAGKKNLYEGGIRAYTILKGPGFTSTNITWPGLAHAIDWFPTLIAAAGGGRLSYTQGYDLYHSIKENRDSPREDFIIVSDFPKFNHTLLRWKQWKLFTAIPGLEPDSRWIPGFSSGWYPPYQLLESGVPWENSFHKYSPRQYLLYNLEQDPYERTDVYKGMKNSMVVQTMKNKIDEYLGTPGVRSGTFPLQPWPRVIPRSKDNTKDGILVTCWCHPSGLPNCQGDVTKPPESNRTRGPTSGAENATASRVTLLVLVLVLKGVGVFCLSPL